MRASCVRTLTRTYCWQRRRYLLERTCLHLLAPLDSRLLLADSVKMKILFLFFLLLFKKGMNTFVCFTWGTGYGIHMHSLALCFGESMVTQDKNRMEECLSCTAVFHTQCRQLKLYSLSLMTKMVSGGRAGTHQSSHCWYKFHPFCFSPPQPHHVIFPLDALPVDTPPAAIPMLLFSFSLAFGSPGTSPFPWRWEIIATNAVIKNSSQFISQENWVWALFCLLWCLHVLCQHCVSARSPQFRVSAKERLCSYSSSCPSVPSFWGGW